ncbi:hypothetical protein JTB14_006523 [Gonioctena quinquepunctata]|nr:hypothetical protein JTB14_006523 [Gonioctena quinquepunctata]
MPEVLQSDSALKERKTIQKLSTDKAWIAEQFAKVQNFISYSQLFDPSMVTPNNIKPPSIKAFIYITSVLFREMFPNVQLTSQNYKDVIPQKLKMLHYPGTIALSVLKTVNTMHAWPQVIGMFAWLIDKINIVKGPDNISLDNMEVEDRQKYLLTKNALDFLETRYLIFNVHNDNPEDIAAANAEYVKNIADILEFDPEEHARIEKDILQKREYWTALETETEKCEAENQQMESQQAEMKAELQRAIDGIAQRKAESDAEMQRLDKALQKIEEKTVRAEDNIAELKERLNSQPCTYKEKLELLKRIEALKNNRDIVKGRIMHAQKIKNDFDARLTAEQLTLQSQVLEWNRSLMEVSIKKPQLKTLVLKDTGLHNPSFLDEIKEVSRLKVEIDNEIAQRMASIDVELREIAARNKAIEVKISSLEKMLVEFDEQIGKKREENAQIVENLGKETIQFVKEKEVLTQELNDPRKTEELNTLVEKESHLRLEMETLDKEVRKLGKKILCFFIDLYKQLRQEISGMQDIMRNMEGRLAEQVVEARHKRLKVQDALTVLKELEDSINDDEN